MLWLIELHGRIEREEKENFSLPICWQEPLPYFFRVSCYGDLAQTFGMPSPWELVDPNSVRQRACFPTGRPPPPSLLSICVWSASLHQVSLCEKNPWSQILFESEWYDNDNSHGNPSNMDTDWAPLFAFFWTSAIWLLLWENTPETGVPGVDPRQHGENKQALHTHDLAVPPSPNFHSGFQFQLPGEHIPIIYKYEF